jgi:hypothetical protein
MALNQRQDFVIVSDWEPYLGSLFCVWFCGWLSSVFVSLHQIGLFRFLTFCYFVVFTFIVFIKHVRH